MPHRHALLPTSLLAFALALAPAFARAAIEVQPFPPRPAASALLMLDLAGDWPGGCAPAADNAQRDGRTITVRLAPTSGCRASADRFAFRVGAGGARWGSSGVYRVKVLGPDAPDGGERLLAFRLVEVGIANGTAEPEPGFWWNEQGGEFGSAGPGAGVTMERQGDTLAVTLFGYNDRGAPQWLFGAGPVRGHMASVHLARLSGGAGPFDRYQPPTRSEAVGTLHLEFASDARATAWLERPDPAGGVRVSPLSLVRFRFGEAAGEAWLGEWLVLAGRNRDEAPLRVHFDRFERTEAGFVLSAADDTTLSCTMSPQRPNSPPARCLLLDADNRTLGDFGDVALDRLRGWRPDGSDVTALHRRP